MNKIGFHADPQPKTTDQRLLEAVNKRDQASETSAVSGLVSPGPWDDFWGRKKSARKAQEKGK